MHSFLLQSAHVLLASSLELVAHDYVGLAFQPASLVGVVVEFVAVGVGGRNMGVSFLVVRDVVLLAR